MAGTAAAAASLGSWEAAARLARNNDTLRAEVLRRADAAEHRVVQLFGNEPLFAGVPPRWNTDLRSGFGWPRIHHAEIDYRNVGRPSDVKVVWELSRMRHLVHLAQGAAVTPDPRYTAAIAADLVSWHRANPLGGTVNWACAMEVALRSLNLICVDAILVACERRHPQRPLLVPSLYQHGWFLRRNLEVSDVNGNHFLADAVGLVWLGRYFGTFGEAPKWFAKGCEMVRDAAAEQVLSDGVDHEGSLPYHLLVTEMFLLARHAAGNPLASIDGTLAAMTDVICAVAGPEGRIPDLGDDDGGRVAAFGDTPSNDARRVLGLAAAVIDYPVPTAAAASAICDDALWLRGPATTGTKPGTSSANRRPRHFEHAGLVVLGDGDDRVVIDAGPVGFRSRGGHGHLDAMSFEAVLGRRIAVRDSGTGSYTGDPALREILRGVRAHTVVIVDECAYAELGGFAELWRITGDARPKVIALEKSANGHTVRLEQHLPAAAGKAVHRRTIEWRSGSLRWSDEVSAPPSAVVEHLVQLPDGCVLQAHRIEHPVFEYEAGLPVGATLTLESAPWSPRYGSVEEGLRAMVSYSATEETAVVTWVVRATT